MPKKYTKAKFFKPSGLTYPPSMCESRNQTSCFIKYQSCGSTAAPTTFFSSELDLNQCQAAADAIPSSKGDMWFYDASANIRVHEHWDNCANPICHIDYYNCFTGALLGTYEGPDSTPTECFARLDDLGPANAAGSWDPGNGEPILYDNLNTCPVYGGQAYFWIADDNTPRLHIDFIYTVGIWDLHVDLAPQAVTPTEPDYFIIEGQPDWPSVLDLQIYAHFNYEGLGYTWLDHISYHFAADPGGIPVSVIYPIP